MEGVAGLSSADSTDKSSEAAQRSTHGHPHYVEEIARLKGLLAEATEALQIADKARISSSSDQLQETIDELLVEKTTVRHLHTSTTPAESISSLKPFRATYKPSSLRRRMRPRTYENVSSVARQSSRLCAKRRTVTPPSLIAFSRPVNCHHLLRGMTLSLPLFVKRSPDLSEPNLIYVHPSPID